MSQGTSLGACLTLGGLCWDVKTFCLRAGDGFQSLSPVRSAVRANEASEGETGNRDLLSQPYLPVEVSGPTTWLWSRVNGIVSRM